MSLPPDAPILKSKRMDRSDWLWIAGLGLAAVGYWQCRDVDGSGTPLTEVRAIASASEIDVRGEVRVEVAVGPEPRVELSGDDNIVPLVETKVDGSRLVVKTSREVDPDVPLVLRVTMPDVRKIEGSGAITVDVTGVDNDRLEIDLSGSGKVTAAGRTDHLVVDISGSGEADTRALAAKRVEIEISGSADIDVGEPEELDVDVSGSGTVRYAGNPRIDQDISGSGKVVRR